VSDRSEALEFLKGLTDSLFDEAVEVAGIDRSHLPGTGQSQAQRAIALLDLASSEGREEALYRWIVAKRAPRPRRSGVKPHRSAPHPRVEDVFVGRERERAELAAAVFPAGGTLRAVVVSGMAGVGKSYLVDRFFYENTARFPGGYVRLPLDPDNLVSVADLLTTLRDRLKLPARDDEALAARLLMPLTLVHIENADNFLAAEVACEFAESVPGCTLVISARFRDLGFGYGWPEVALSPFDKNTALQQSQAELGPDAPGQSSWPALVESLGFLPLAIHLAAGHLRKGYRAQTFLRRLREKKLALEGANPLDPSFRDRSRAQLSHSFELSLTALQREGNTEGDSWLQGFSMLGHAPASGFGESLGAAISGLGSETFEDMALAAARLSLVDRVPRTEGSAFRLHPLLAEFVRPRADREAASARTTEWFTARLPEGGNDQGQRWREIQEEIATLTEWLAQVSSADRVRVIRAGIRYAIRNGPYHAWLRFCEETLADKINIEDRSNCLSMLGYVALHGGNLSRALQAAEEKRTLDLIRGQHREAALATGLLANIMEQQGDLESALRILQEDQIPLYQRLGDDRQVAVTKGKIAAIMEARGDFEGALLIRTKEELPVFQRLREERAAAFTRERIAGIFQERGDLNEALRILQDEVLPVFHKLGEVRSAAIMKGKIADLMRRCGDIDGAIRLRRAEELPVYERLNDMNLLIVGRTHLATDLLRRKREGDREEAADLLRMALEEARRLKLPEVQQIEQMQEQVRLIGG
jgi:hypothetical protein